MSRELESREWLDRIRYRLRTIGGYKLSKFPGKELYNVLDGENRQSVIPGTPGIFWTMTREDVEQFVEENREELKLPRFRKKGEVK